MDTLDAGAPPMLVYRATLLAGVSNVTKRRARREQITRRVSLPRPRSIAQRIGWDGPKSAALIH
jgi:hypothetical protein